MARLPAHRHPQFRQILFTSLDCILFGGSMTISAAASSATRWTNAGGSLIRENALRQGADDRFCAGIWQFNRNELCRQRVTETINFLMRDMKVGDAFAAPISSGPQIEDGKYYTWSEAEIDAGLAGTFSARFKQVYGITRDGNVQGRNLPQRLGNPAPANDADEALLAKQRDMLLAARAKRAAPFRDDALRHRERAGHRRFVACRHCVRKAGMGAGRHRRFRRHCEKPGRRGRRLSHVAGARGVADDYADMARAALQLLEVTGDQRFLAQPKSWAQYLDEHFWNNQIGGYCFYADNSEQLFVRPRMVFDNPAPSANGTMLIVLDAAGAAYRRKGLHGAGLRFVQLLGNEANRMVNGAGTTERAGISDQHP